MNCAYCRNRQLAFLTMNVLTEADAPGRDDRVVFLYSLVPGVDKNQQTFMLTASAVLSRLPQQEHSRF